MKSIQILFLVALSGNSLLVSADQASDAGNSSPGRLMQIFQSQRASGSIRANYYRSSKTFDDNTDFYGVTAQAKTLPQFSDKIDGKFEGRITNSTPNDGTANEGRLIEAYATVHFSKSDLRIGKQIVAWGRADGINPTDNLTPPTLTYGQASGTVFPLGTTSVLVTATDDAGNRSQATLTVTVVAAQQSLAARRAACRRWWEVGGDCRRRAGATPRGGRRRWGVAGWPCT